MNESEKQKRFDKLRVEYLRLWALRHEMNMIYIDSLLDDIEYQMEMLELGKET